MTAPYRPIIGTLGYIVSEDGRRTLLVHRIAREDDDHLGKYNGVGGKMHPDEDVVACMRREVKEETGLDVLAMTLRGTVNWTGFGPNGEDWLGFIFRIDRTAGEAYRENEEGPLAWHDIADLDTLPMWEGDRRFLPLVFDDDPRMFHGYMPYDGDTPTDWVWSRV